MTCFPHFKTLKKKKKSIKREHKNSLIYRSPQRPERCVLQAKKSTRKSLWSDLLPRRFLELRHSARAPRTSNRPRDEVTHTPRGESSRAAKEVGASKNLRGARTTYNHLLLARSIRFIIYIDHCSGSAELSCNSWSAPAHIVKIWRIPRYRVRASGL